jgi:hypothetical protein
VFRKENDHEKEDFELANRSIQASTFPINHLTSPSALRLSNQVRYRFNELVRFQINTGGERRSLIVVEVEEYETKLRW